MVKQTADQYIAEARDEQSRIASAETILSRDGILRLLMEMVISDHGLSRPEFLSNGRSKKLGEARQEFYFRALTHTTKPSKLIGAATGKDHTTALYGAAVYAKKMGRPAPRGATCSKVLGNEHRRFGGN